MEPFLKPLSAQEEKSCLDAYQRGDTKARDILVERNLRLVAHVVKKYQGLPDDLDDLISIGTIGLIKAVMTYDSKKGNRLAAYAARCIDNELLMYLRSKKKTAREISLYEPIGTDKEGNEIHLLDIVEGGAHRCGRISQSADAGAAGQRKIHDRKADSDDHASDV